MTREEQLACLEDRPCSVCKFHTDRCNRWTCVFEDEPEDQEPCEDSISRQAVIDLVIANHTELNGLNVVMYSPFYKDIKQLPPVNSQESKTGHWIVHQKGIYAHLVCDKCLSNAPYDCRTNYCPNCGCAMAKGEIRDNG